MNRQMRPTAFVSIVVLAAALSDCSSDQRNPVAPTMPPSPAAAGTFTLSGSVFESTREGRAPVAGARVEVAICPTKLANAVASTVANASGYFEVSHMCSGVTYIWVEKEGFRTHPPTQCDGDCLLTAIDGNTHFDVELFRQ